MIRRSWGRIPLYTIQCCGVFTLDRMVVFTLLCLELLFVTLSHNYISSAINRSNMVKKRLQIKSFVILINCVIIFGIGITADY